MKPTLILALSTLILSAAARPFSLTSLFARGCQPAEGVATDGNQFWADNCDLGAGEDGWGQKLKRMAGTLLDKRHGPGHWDNNQGQQQQQNNNNGGHDALWNGVYEQTPNCTPADGVATDGNQFWADNCDLGAGENGFGQ